MDLSPEEKLYKFCPSCKSELSSKVIDSRDRFYCPSCNFIFWNNPKPVVSVLLHKKGKILMLQRASEPLKDYWCLPGGYIHYDETPEEAVKRELKEETGIESTVNSLIGVFRIDNDPRGVNIDIIYESELEGQVKLSKEHQKFELFSPENLPDKVAYKHKEAIDEWAESH